MVLVDKRKFPRYPLTVPSRAHLRQEDGKTVTFPCEIVNISEGGLMLSAKDPLMAVGQTVIIEIDFRDGLKVKGKVKQVDPVEFEISEDNLEQSEVRWVDSSSGHFGVEFSGLDSGKKALLKQLVEELGKGAELEDV